MKRTKTEEKGSPQKGEDPGEGSGGPRTQTGQKACLRKTVLLGKRMREIDFS